MNIQQLQRTIIDALEDVKAQDIQVYNTTHLTAMFDRVVIASGTSNRQTKALAASVRDQVKSSGGHIISTEGEDTGEWVLVDCGDAIVHIMQPAIRQYYHLEDIWGDKPVAIKRAAAPSASRRRASEAPEAAVAAVAATQAAPTGKTASKKRSSTQTGSKKAPAKTIAAAKSPARKTPAKKSPARKTGAVHATPRATPRASAARKSGRVAPATPRPSAPRKSAARKTVKPR